MYERESIWALIGMGGAAVFLCACALSRRAWDWAC